MTADDRADALLAAEASIASGVETFVRLLGLERGGEVAAALVADRLRSLASRHKIVASLAREVAHADAG